MLNGLFYKYNNVIGKRLFVKIALSFSCIAAISIIIVGMIISNTAVNIYSRNELRYEEQIITQADNYIHEKESAFNKIIKNIYNTSRMENLSIINYLLADESDTVINNPHLAP